MHVFFDNETISRFSCTNNSLPSAWFIYMYTPYIYRTICPLTRTSISTCTTFMKRTSTVRPIVLSHVQSSDHLITHAILSNYYTTFDLIVQQLHIYTRFNAFVSHNCSFRSCKFRRNVFFFLSFIILALVYNPNPAFVPIGRVLKEILYL